MKTREEKSGSNLKSFQKNEEFFLGKHKQCPHTEEGWETGIINWNGTFWLDTVGQGAERITMRGEPGEGQAAQSRGWATSFPVSLQDPAGKAQSNLVRGEMWLWAGVSLEITRGNVNFRR